MISQAGWWTRTPFTNALQPIKWNATFWITFNFWWLAGLVNGLKPHPPFLCSQRNEMLIFVLCSTSNDQPGLSVTWTASTTCLQPKNEMLIFQLCSTSDDWPGWSMDSNPIHHPSPAKKMKSSFFITFNFWCWPDWSMDLKPICHPSPAKKNEMLVFRLRSFLMICLADWWIWSPSATPLQPKRWNAQFLIMFNFWWSARLVDGLKPHLPPSPAKKMKCTFLYYIQLLMLARLVDGLKPHPPPSPPQKMKCSFFDYVQLLMIGRAGQWTRAPSTTPLQPKKWNAHFCITFNIWCWPDWSMDLNLIHHSTPAKNKKCSFLGHIQLLMISQAVRWTQTPSASPLQPIKWNAHFWITFTSDDLPGWLMNLNLICHPSHTKKMKCSIFDYIQLLMISQTGQLT